MADLCATCMRNGSRALLKALQAELPDEMPPVRISIRGLALHAASMAGETAADLLGPARPKHLTRLRHAMVLVAIEYPFSLPQIGRAMGGRDHSTIINSRERGRELVKRDPDYAWLVERLWAAAECEPWGPSNKPWVEPEVKIEPEPPSRPISVKFVEPVLPPPPVRSVPGEYTPRHALSPVLAVIGFDPIEPRDADDNYLEQSIIAGSSALLRAMRREHPERCAA